MQNCDVERNVKNVVYMGCKMDVENFLQSVCCSIYCINSVLLIFCLLAIYVGDTLYITVVD